jgi:trehalose 6-phosphate synthase/phosphatase
LNEWEAYKAENTAFFSRIVEIWNPDTDIVVIIDYQLMLLPEMLRARCETATIGLYLRTPFPSSELFRCLPEAKQVLTGVLGANVIGLQTQGYVRHLLSSCTRLLGLESTPKRIDFHGFPVDVVAQPIGIDPNQMRANLRSESVMRRMEVLSKKYSQKASDSSIIVLGIESVDQCSGVLHKLTAISNLFQRYPEWIGRVWYHSKFWTRN